MGSCCFVTAHCYYLWTRSDHYFVSFYVTTLVSPVLFQDWFHRDNSLEYSSVIDWFLPHHSPRFQRLFHLACFLPPVFVGGKVCHGPSFKCSCHLRDHFQVAILWSLANCSRIQRILLRPCFCEVFSDDLSPRPESQSFSHCSRKQTDNSRTQWTQHYCYSIGVNLVSWVTVLLNFHVQTLFMVFPESYQTLGRIQLF